MRNKNAERLAKNAALFVDESFNLRNKGSSKIGIILGTGWGDALPLSGGKSISLERVPGFSRLSEPEGHARRLHHATISGKKVWVLSGRIHMNESLNLPAISQRVRLQIEMLISLGIEKLILCSAVGSLCDFSIKPGDVVVVDGFVTLFAPPMPLYGGEFCSPEDVLDQKLLYMAVDVANDVGMQAHKVGYAMVRGPHFEGKNYDKRFLASTGAGVVGMSILPEACIAALYSPDVKVLGLGFVTNSAFEEHSHEENIRRARAESRKLGKLLEGIVSLAE